MKFFVVVVALALSHRVNQVFDGYSCLKAIHRVVSDEEAYAVTFFRTLCFSFSPLRNISKFIHIHNVNMFSYLIYHFILLHCL